MLPNRLPLLPLVLDDVPWGLRQMLAQEGVPCVDRDRRGGQGRFLLFDSRVGPFPRPLAGQVAIDIDPLRKGFAGDPFREWAGHASQRHQWQLGRFRPSEEIARVDKRGLRRDLMAALREQIERRGGAWVALSAYPFPYRSMFHLRIDYDQYDPHDFERLQSVLAGREHAVSHFVNGAAYDGRWDCLRRLIGQDVGSHGYWHHTYRTCQENLRNLQRGIRVLEGAGLQPSGCTAPLGRFNHSLLQAMEALEIRHSSEFAFAYDELPMFPRGSHVLQVPVHPVSLGILLEAASPEQRLEAVAAARGHFAEWIRARRLAGEPIVLYGHPTGRLGRHPSVVETMFGEVEGCGDVWQVTMTAWAAWWRARRRVRLVVDRDGDDLVVDVLQRPVRHRLAIEFRRGRHVATLPLEGDRLRFSQSALTFERREPAAALRPVRIDRAHGLRGRVRRWVDWERETPPEEIAPTNLRNVAKRTLRTLWR